jgi:glycosyltransferase involved in cell wall biosynthesis
MKQTPLQNHPPRIAAIVPCYNEELTIGKVVADIRKQLPGVVIYVFNNNSTDATEEVAVKSGATVLREKRQGKGFVVQGMFSRVEADIYIMVDGDDTYDLAQLPEMVKLVERDEADMVVGNRLKTYDSGSFRPLHGFGNWLVSFLINQLFGARLEDIMSGFRVMNRSFVKHINIAASGFEVETEMSIKALKYRYVIREVDVHYRERPPGSFSKLKTISDGMLVIRTVFMIFKDYRPFVFFGLASLVLLMVSLVTGGVVIDEFLTTRYIHHVPLAILASGCMILSFLLLMTGVILDTANKRFDEIYMYLRSRGDNG